MKSPVRLSLFATLGAGAIVLSCQPTASQDCTPFPPPSVSGASCSALPKLTRIHDLGNLKPGSQLSDPSLVVDDHAIYFVASPPGVPAASLYWMSKAGGDPQVIDQGVAAPVVLDGPSLIYSRMVARGQASPNVIQLGPQCLSEALPGAGGAISRGGGPIVDGTGGVDWLTLTHPWPDLQLLHWDPRTDSTAVIAVIGAGDNLPWFSFVGDADHVYWTGFSEGIGPSAITTIVSEPSAGGAQATLASVPGVLAIVGVDDEALYMGKSPYVASNGQGFGEGPITRVLKTNGSATTVVADDCSATAYGVHDTHVYWALGSKVLRAPKTGGPAEVVSNLGDANTTLLSIAFDACNVYVITQPTNSTSSSIWGAPLPQGSPTSADDASALACDEEGDTDASTADADEQ